MLVSMMEDTLSLLLEYGFLVLNKSRIINLFPEWHLGIKNFCYDL